MPPKSVFLLAVLVTTMPVSALLAQTARETLVKVAKDPQPALLADYDHPANVVQTALKNRFEVLGFGDGSSSKGFILYKGVTWSAVSGDRLDVYTRVDSKGDKSTVTMLLSTGNENFISATSDALAMERAKTFLNSLSTDAATQSLRRSIAAQEEAVLRAEKEASQEAKRGESLAREQEKLQERIADNKRAQAGRDAKVREEKTRLETLKKQLGKGK